MKFKAIHIDAIQGLLWLVDEYSNHLEAKTIQEHWVLHELHQLVNRLWLLRQKMQLQRKTRATLHLPYRLCFVFATLMQRHSFNVTDYTDNVIRTMLTQIYQHFNVTK